MRNLTITFFLMISVFTQSCGQSSPNLKSGFVQYEGPTTQLHEANIGNIVFMTSLKHLHKYDENDFLSSFEIRDESDLTFTAFFDNSLTNYLHELAPDLTADELLQKGNYQFSFYVDEQLIYTENLNLGAGLPDQKNKDTFLRKPLLSSTNIDSWGRFMWMRFFHRNGGEAAIGKGSHTLKIEIRPYLKNDNLIVGDIIAKGQVSIKMAELKAVPEKMKAIQRIQTNSGWELSKDSYYKDKIRALNEKIAQKKFKDITSIVVIKDGKLLIEEYFNGADRSTLHDTRSVGKSFGSTLTGMAIEDGYLTGIDQKLKEFYNLSDFANYSMKKDLVTLKSLMTMSSGFDGSDSNYDSPGNEEKMHPTDDWIKFTLDLAMDESKEIGEKWDYFTAGVVVLGDIIDKSVPNGLEKYADEKLFKPLGIVDYQWQYTPQNKVSLAGGMEMRALDFAKYGQLYKNKGLWNGKQILSADWVQQTMTNYFSETPDQTAYGFLFWNQVFSVNGKSYEAYLCSGNGGNKVIVFEDEPLVIIITATAYNQPYSHSQVHKMLQEYILPAVVK